ncbi:hypothetical protein HGT71_05785 [Rosenbergiella epipactidis]|uniref:hypothetical protein n=1 Tax=Rosenbergiella epipactidis TaxID=1544694 RepID=UPI001BDABAD0|nr:hypothetical protein [Rosenbergiella epipactidis]MBT0717782.1 hypothetical protein [Rosenbergiella epipactidis]
MKESILMLLFLVFTSTQVLANSDKNTDHRLDLLMGKNTHKQYQNFFEKLKKSALINDKNTISSMVEYPITVTVGHKEIEIENRNEFIVEYNTIFTKDLVGKIINQKYSDLFIKDTGIMIGKSGEILFGGICTVSDCSKFKIKIMQINN